MNDISCFKAYDVRGQIGVNFGPEIARLIGRALVATLNASTVAIGHDCRLSSPQIAEQFARGVREMGADVFDLGMSGSEEVYFATNFLGADAGVVVTASHNPADYNGLKFVGPGARPLSPDEYTQLKELTASSNVTPAERSGKIERKNTRSAYAQHLVGLVSRTLTRPLHIVANIGNGVAGAALDAILLELGKLGSNVRVSTLFETPDGSFPNGVPNPLLPENHTVTSNAIKSHNADFGVAWDGDFDRCFFFDGSGRFLNGEYVVALLAKASLANAPAAVVVHDPRSVWAIEQTVGETGGTAVRAPTGHSFMKREMRARQAIYGGELSAHHYFSDFMYCDTGMIPLLKMLELLNSTDQSLEHLVSNLRSDWPSSGELNFRVADPERVVANIKDELLPLSNSHDFQDGLSIEFDTWRVNLRISNTEPLLRLNVETRGDQELLNEKVADLSARIATQ